MEQIEGIANELRELVVTAKGSGRPPRDEVPVFEFAVADDGVAVGEPDGVTVPDLAVLVAAWCW